MSSHLRVAIIGCGAVIEQRYLAAFRKLRWQPSALIDPSSERRKKIASFFSNAPAQAQSAGELLDAFDAAIVATPHNFHEPLCIELLRAGKSVLVEKPMAPTFTACQAINAAASQGKAHVAVALMRRQSPALQWLKEALDAGAMGKLSSFTIREGYEYSWPLATDAMWRKALSGGGVLMDTGAHTMDEVVWWFGEPDELEYFDDADGGVEADCRIKMRWKSGLTGTVDLSRTTTLSNALTLHSDKGTFSVGMTGQGAKAVRGTFDYVSPTVGAMPSAAVDLFGKQLAAFERYIRGEPVVLATGEDGAKSVKVIERCYASRQSLNFPWTPYKTSQPLAAE